MNHAPEDTASLKPEADMRNKSEYRRYAVLILAAAGLKTCALLSSGSPGPAPAQAAAPTRSDAGFGGYNFWLQKLEQFRGDFVQAEMVKAFITSIEYRRRFGQP